MSLRIECPGCQRAFEVNKDLEGRTVECGSCEKRFQVAPNVMIANRGRFYPDEAKKGADLSRFGRAPMTNAPVEFQTTAYDKGPKQAFLGPVPPIRHFAAGAGLLAILVGLALLYFGSLPSSDLLRDVERPNRYILGGFLSLVSFGFLVWGMLRNRMLGFFLGLCGAGGLMALAHFSPIHRAVNANAPLISDNFAENSLAQGETEEAPTFFPGITDEVLSAEEVKRLTRWEAAVFPVIGQGDETHVAAVWVRSMEEFHGRQVQNYLAQQFGLPENPYFRELGSDGGIFVMSGIPFELDDVEAVVERFGEVEQTIPELRLIQMQANPAVLGEVSSRLTAKLNDPNDGSFYPLNHAELIALDRERVKRAIDRLSLAKPIRMRKDITVRLVALLSEDFDEATFDQLAKAIEIWSEDGDGAERVVADLGVRMRAQGRKIPDGMLNFIATRKPAAAASLMVDVWSRDPTSKQRFVAQYGSQAAPLLPSYLTSDDSGVRRSAARLLGQIGGKEQLTSMREAMNETSDSELKSILVESIARIQKGS